MVGETFEDLDAGRVLEFREETDGDFDKIVIGRLKSAGDVERFETDSTVWMSSFDGIQEVQRVQRRVS